MTTPVSPPSRHQRRLHDDTSVVPIRPENQTIEPDQLQRPAAITPADVTEVWNEHRGGLPGLRRAPTTGEPARLMAQVIEWFGEDRDALRRSIQRVSSDDYYVEHRHGFTAWARHLDRFDDPGVAERPQDEPVAERPQEIDVEGQAKLRQLLAGVGTQTS